MSVLFISYNGILEPLGQSQVLPYVRGLARRGHRMRLLSFEKAAKGSVLWTTTERCLREEQIDWRPLLYHKSPPVLSTVYDAVQGLRRARADRSGGVRLIHARSHVPAFIADLSRSLGGAPYLFDHRGLMAEEFADAGIWTRGGVLFELAQMWERRFLRRAARVVVLTQRLRDELPVPRSRVAVIPCAVDLTKFHPAPPGDERPFDLVYAGSWSGLYLSGEMLTFFEVYRSFRRQARFLVLVPGAGDAGGVPEGVELRHAAPDEVPALLRKARAGISLRRPGAAQRASSPVKVAEYLATGLPVVSSLGVGDLDALLSANATGVVLPGFAPEQLRRGAETLLRLLDDAGTSSRCRQLAMSHYDLETAIRSYDAVYRVLLGELEHT